MPRRSSATPTAAALEQQIAQDADLRPELGDLDEHGLERLPEFGPSKANGVRPSERCGTPAPPGAHFGARCEFRDEHAGRHSWQPETREPQPALPGTPEPEPDPFEIPTEASFGQAKLQPAPGLKAIGERLIEDDDNLEHLRGVEIRYAWRRRGGLAGGSPWFARIKRPSIWEGYLTGGKVEFLVDVAADHVREQRFTERQIEAALHEQLVRTERDEDDHDAFRINGPDFQGTIATLDRYGAWRPELREMSAHARLLPLDQALADAEDDSEEGEEDE